MKDKREIDKESSGNDHRTIAQILQEMADHIREILRSEVRLASTEVRHDVAEYGKAGAILGAAGVLGLYALAFVLLSVMFALQTVLPPSLAALTVGVFMGTLAGSLLLVGMSRRKRLNLKPEKTIQSLEENIKWFRERTR